MSKFEFAIACRDEADLASGHKRKKEGDIIAVKPYPWQWGAKEVDAHLIVIVDNLTQEEAHNLCKPQYEDGSLNPVEDMEGTLVERLPDTEYATGDIVLVDGWAYWCKSGGTTGSDPIPVFEKKIPTIINDGTVQWKCKGKKNPAVTAKRNFKFKLNKLKADLFPGLDIARVNDNTDVYQPLKDGDIAIDAETMTMVYDIFNDEDIKKAVDPFTEA